MEWLTCSAVTGSEYAGPPIGRRLTVATAPVSVLRTAVSAAG